MDYAEQRTNEQRLVMESAKFLDEVQQRALRNVAELILPVNNNQIQFSGFTFRSTDNSPVIEWRINFHINDQFHPLSGSLDILDQESPYGTIRDMLVVAVRAVVLQELISHIDFVVKKFEYQLKNK